MIEQLLYDFSHALLVTVMLLTVTALAMAQRTDVHRSRVTL